MIIEVVNINLLQCPRISTGVADKWIQKQSRLAEPWSQLTASLMWSQPERVSLELPTVTLDDCCRCAHLLAAPRSASSSSTEGISSRRLKRSSAWIKIGSDEKCRGRKETTALQGGLLCAIHRNIEPCLLTKTNDGRKWNNRNKTDEKHTDNNVWINQSINQLIHWSSVNFNQIEDSLPSYQKSSHGFSKERSSTHWTRVNCRRFRSLDIMPWTGGSHNTAYVIILRDITRTKREQMVEVALYCCLSDCS